MANIRKHIQDWIEDYQTTDNYSIGNSQLNWLSDNQEWQLVLPNGEIHYEGSGCGVADLIRLISDEDIEDYYPSIEEYFEEVAE